MRITIESTTKTVDLVDPVTQATTPARVWEGTTDSGIPVHCFVTRIAVHKAQDATQFERELVEQRAPSRLVDQTYGITLPGIGMGGGASRYAYYLGGSGDAFVQSPTPTWVAAGPLLVQLNTVARLSTTAQVTAQIRAADAGVSVQARLYDYTLGAPATGTSAVITSTTWSTVTFTVTLNPGSDYFGLQLLPGAAGAGVAGVGYVE